MVARMVKIYSPRSTVAMIEIAITAENVAVCSIQSGTYVANGALKVQKFTAWGNAPETIPT